MIIDEHYREGLFDHHDLNPIFHLTSPVEVIHLVEKFHADRAKVEHICHNFRKYRIELDSL